MSRRVLAVATLVALAVTGCGGEDEDETPSTQLKRCEQVDQPELQEEAERSPPDGELDPGKTYKVSVETSCGLFTITLDPDSAPNATASFAELARDEFYDDTAFHRVVPGFVIQGGDPTGTGTGGPGYETSDPPPLGASYTRGVVAMARSDAQAPGAAGSQFFVVVGRDIGLAPYYVIIGKVTSGLAVVDRIARLGDASTQEPRRPVVIRRMRVEESEEQTTGTTP